MNLIGEAVTGPALLGTDCQADNNAFTLYAGTVVREG
jgi:hypothetical protein